MKYSEILFGVLRIPIDLAATFGALLLAYWLRASSIDLLPGIQLLKEPLLPEPPDYILGFALPAAILYVFLIFSLRLYALRITIGAWREIGRIFVVSGLWLALVIAWYFLVTKQLFFSRALLLMATVLISIFVAFGRGLITLIQRAFLKRGIGVRAVLSIGSQHLPEVARRTLATDIRFKYLGHVHSRDGLAWEQNIDLLLHTDPNPNSAETSELIDYCRSHYIGYAFLPPIFADVPHQLSIGHLGLVPLLQFEPTPLDGWGRAWKRLFDIIISAVLLILLSPLLCAIALLVMITSGRPIFYISRRVGQQGADLIPILKFRTMVVNADELRATLAPLSHRNDGPLFKIRNDPRVTPIGRLLRRWSLDELPQLFNVFAGQLSMVGPRPHLAEEVQKYNDYQRRAFAVRPGITGLAQVSGRSNLKFETEVQLDIQYIEEWSLLLDLWILWRTIFVVIKREGAD